jgi:N-acyl-L-homoserine lactone synthetase
MATTEEKVNCVFRLVELKSVTTVKRGFTALYRKETPHRNRNSIENWMKALNKLGP